MTNWMMGNFDIVIALVLVVVVVITFVISQIGLLPKRSLPFVAAALMGVFGIAIFRSWRKNSLRADLAKREEVLKQKEKELEEKKKDMTVSQRELEKVQAEVNRHKAAYQKELLVIEAKKQEDIDAIDKMSDEEVFKKYLETFGGG